MNLENFREEIEYYIENYEENAPVLRRIKEKALKLNKQINDEYTLVFMAEKGAGKTTTIDYLLDLTFEKEKVNEKTKKKYKVEEDVLETGSGATTTSEVEISQSEDGVSKIIVTPYSIDDVLDILKIYSKTVFSNAHNIKIDDEQLAPELLRACKNMTGLTEKKNEDGVKTDLAIEFAQKFDESNYSDFENAVIEKAKLLEREITEFVFDGVGEERAWIKKYFRRLNLVHIQDAPLPKKITVKLSKEIFDFSEFNKVKRILDTRGLEVSSNTDRSDIKSIFRDADDTIVLMVDKFNSPSKSIIDLVSHYVYDEKMGIVDRLGYIVNFRDGEAEKVVGFNGIIENEEEGISEKRNQVVQIFKDNEVFIREENIFYANPRRHLDQEGKIKITADELEEYDYDKLAVETVKKEDRLSERNLFVDDLVSFINDYDEKLKNELEEVMKNYEDIKADIEKNANINVEEVVKFISEKEIAIDIKEEVGELYDEYIDDKFPSTLRAINNRFGIFNSNDIYCEGANVIEKYAKHPLKMLRDGVVEKINETTTNKKLNSNQEKAREFIVSDINSYFFNFVSNINTRYYEKLQNEIFKTTNEDFWDRVKRRWGKGSGYRRDIVKFYKDNIKEQEFHIDINDEMEDMINDFKNGIIDILNNSKE